MSLGSANSWVVLPLIQMLMTLSAGFLLYIYGRQVSKQMGGGIISKMMSFVIIISFLIAVFTLLSLFGYLWVNIALLALANFMIMLIAAGELLLAFHVKKISVELNKMISDE